MAILVGVVLLAAIAYYVSRPLMNARRGSGVGVDVASLEVQRDLVYDQIRELDMDHATGKTNDEDHQRIRAELVAQAAALLKQIDGVAQQPIAVSAPAVADDEIEALITARRKAKPATLAKPSEADLEAAIAARRKTPTAAPKIDRDVEAAIAERRKVPASQASPILACPKCGKPINADDAFCAKCGTALQPQATH